MTERQDSDFNLRRFDLNLLPILKALLATHSVTKASEILGLSQSATSGALTRLRGMFGDPLLVQVGRHLVPTPRAIELQPLVEDAFSQMHTVFEKRVFDPVIEERSVVICTSDFIVSTLCVPLMNILSVEAPGISVKFVPVSVATQIAMVSGEIDFMMTPQNNPASEESVHSIVILEEEMAIITSDTFATPAGGLDMATYLAADHAVYAVSDSKSFEQWALDELGITRRVRIMVPQFTILPECVAGTGTVAMVPRFVAERAAKSYPLKVWPVPFEMPVMRTSLYWSNVLHLNPPHQWLRQVIERAWHIATGR